MRFVAKGGVIFDFFVRNCVVIACEHYALSCVLSVIP